MISIVPRILLFLSILLAGCDQRPQTPVREEQMPSRRNIDSVLHDHVSQLMSVSGVVGVFRGETEQGDPCIKVMVEKKTAEHTRALPQSLEGYPVIVEETGKIRPLR